ncbi:hypothetical protein M3Y97_00913100 [Aphelenchoides bicaudatus]|nr:hypothetical protein M3Y97_00913100 [Aphelenchoides bicaudatus]
MCGDYGAENEEERKERDEKVSAKVHQYFRKGLPREEIIARIFKKLEYPETDLNEIRSWFDESSEKHSNFYMGRTYNLVSKTVEVPLNIIGEFISDTQLADFKLEVIDSEYIVLIGNHHYTKSFYIHLCKIDLIQRTCTFVGSKRFEGRFECLVFDCKQRRHFGVYFRDHEYTKHYLHVANVESSQLIVQPTRIEIGQMLHKPLRLNGNKLQLFEHWFDPNDFKFIEYDLIPGQEKPEAKHLFTVQSEEDLTNKEVTYCWTCTKCYVLSFNYKTNKLVITIFDLEQQKLVTTLRHLAYLYRGLGSIYVDDKEQVLMIYADDGTHSFGVYCFPLNEQEMRLTTKIFLKLRRDAMFYGDTKHKKQFSELPAKYQPFAICFNYV